MSISWPPIASISSRMICSTFWCTRQPSGRNVQTPALTWRMYPPRTSSLCETASASAGGLAQGRDEELGLAGNHEAPRLAPCARRR